MTHENQQSGKESQQETSGGRKMTALIVALVCIGIGGIVVALNSGRLPVQSDISGQPTPQELNSLPEILDVSPATGPILPSDTCQLVCEATDDDGDALTYTWEASRGEIIGEGSTVEWAAPDDEGLFRVSLTVEDGRGGTAEYTTSLRVRENAAPKISDLSAASEVVVPGESVYISCSASDADGDRVTYEWSAGEGEIFGEGEAIIWLAPDETGSYRVEVAVRDEYGAEAARETAMNVAESESPRLGRFRVKGIDTDLLELNDGIWDIFRGRSCSIKCVVLEGEEPYTYEWSVDYGTLTADGELARWDAPEEQGLATVVVDVTDAEGNTTTDIVYLYVQTCPCAFS